MPAARQETGRQAAALRGQEISLRRSRTRGKVLRHVHALPVSALDAFTNLCSGPAFPRLLVGVEVFAFADPAYRRVLAHIAIEQAAVALAAVAVAIAWLLIKDF